MSELSSFSESQSFISEYNLGPNEQSLMDLEEKSSTGKIKSNSIEQSFFEKNVINVSNKNNESINGLALPVKKNVHSKYPLTEKSKRDKAAKDRMERERKFEQIKKVNDNITRGVKAIKNSTRKVQTNKFPSLVRINNSQWYRHDRTSTYDLQNSSFNAKIESLELKLKTLEDELMLEKNRLTNNVKKRAITTDGDNNYTASDDNPIDVNIDKNEEVTRQDHLNTMKCLDDLACMNVGILNGNVRQTVSKLETRLTFNPKQITLKVKRTNPDVVTIIGIFKQQITVSNRCKSAVFCRYSRLYDPNSVFQNSLDVIRVQPVAWCRLRPGITVDYAVTFKSVKLPNSGIDYPGLEGSKLVFETASNDRPDVLYVFHIPVEFCMIKPEPELVTKTITFAVDLNSSKNINPKKYLIVKNNGDADCVFSVLGETEYQRTHSNNGSLAASYFTETTQDNTSVRIIGDIINFMFHNVFQHFMWRNHRDVLLPARRSVKIPVKFNESLARSSISECYTIVFHNNEHNVIPDQKFYVTGHVRNRIIVKPDVIDVGLCYLTSSIQVARIHLQNDNRVMVPFEVKLPRELSRHVQLSHSKGCLKAGSAIEVFVRLNLKYDILNMDSCKTYFNADSGSLDFPIWVYQSNSKVSFEVRVVAVVTTPFGLKLTPDTLNFGTVNTTETVVRSVVLANYSRTTMAYGFLKLPERVSVYPSAFGTIFSGENLLLQVHYSPSAKDLPENIHTFVDNFVLTCNTITGLNAKEFKSKLNTTEQLHETTTMNTSFSSDGQKLLTISVKNINDLDHGPDKIQIIKMKNMVEVNSLDENAILEEAVITCHATVHEIPVEISVQKIIFATTHFTSYSTFKIELRASNLASVIERNTRSFPDFKIRFEFVSKDPCIEFKPKNGILQSKEVIHICVTFRPKLDTMLQKLYEDNLNSQVTKIITEEISKDPNSYINQICRKETFSNKQINIFEAKTMFYSSMEDKTSIISAACFIQFIQQKSIKYFGFDTGSLKLSLVCPTTKPAVILFSDRIDFGRRAVDVRHDEWLLVRNVTARPVPLRIAPTNPIGPFFCALALNGEQSLLPGHTVPIAVSFTPELETPVNEVLEINSGTMRLTVRLCGRGLRPSCDIVPGDIFNVIQTMHGGPDEKFIFRVTNTSETSVRFNVQLEWTKWHPEPMTDEEAYELAETFRADYSTVPMMLQLDGPDWTELQEGDDEVFDLGNGGRPLWFNLRSGGMHDVEVTFRPPAPVATPRQDRFDDEEMIGRGPESEENCGKSSVNGKTASFSGDSDATVTAAVFRRRVYAAKLNVHVGRTVLRQLYVFGFVI